MEKSNRNLQNYLKFILPSLVGIVLFILPINDHGQFTIPIAVLSNLLMEFFAKYINVILVVLICTSFFGSILIKVIKKINSETKLLKFELIATLFDIKPLSLVIRGISTVYVVITYFFPQYEVIASTATGGLVFSDLLPVLFSIFLLAGICLPLLLNFGLLEFVGTLLIKVMRPVFGLPGRSAVDAIASWLGDGTIGVLLTSKQYEDGYYTEKEACVIGTNFSLVSITFSLVVINTVGLGNMFLQFYLTVTFACIIAAIVIPKLPPLSRKRDTLIDGTKPEHLEEQEGKASASYGVQCALEKVENINVFESIIIDGMKNVIDMWISVIPIVMMVGTTALIIAEYTPIFKYLGLPFVPILQVLGLPEAHAAAQAMFAGFADMLIPSVMVADSVQSDITRFVVAAVSVSQLIYLSEVGALLLASKIPVKLKDLVIIFIERTLITLPIIAGIAHLLF
ncbi:MAG: YjiH family protein [bacterium]|nr:YjiH family protein [bacterium]